MKKTILFLLLLSILPVTFLIVRGVYKYTTHQTAVSVAVEVADKAKRFEDSTAMMKVFDSTEKAYCREKIAYNNKQYNRMYKERREIFPYLFLTKKEERKYLHIIITDSIRDHNYIDSMYKSLYDEVIKCDIRTVKIQLDYL